VLPSLGGLPRFFGFFSGAGGANNSTGAAGKLNACSAAL